MRRKTVTVDEAVRALTRRFREELKREHPGEILARLRALDVPTTAIVAPDGHRYLLALNPDGTRI